jgi:hypothetical protein
MSLAIPGYLATQLDYAIESPEGRETKKIYATYVYILDIHVIVFSHFAVCKASKGRSDRLSRRILCLDI